MFKKTNSIEIIVTIKTRALNILVSVDVKSNTNPLQCLLCLASEYSKVQPVLSKRKESFMLMMCTFLCPPGLYPMDQSEYPGLRSAIERLTLNDSSVTVQRDSSLALGAGWRCGCYEWIIKNGFMEEWGFCCIYCTSRREHRRGF